MEWVTDNLMKKIAYIKKTTPEIVLGIVGSRKRNNDDDFNRVLWIVEQLNPKAIVSGECKSGADAFARRIALTHFIEYIPKPPKFPPNRSKLTKRDINEIYYSRNREICETANVLLALPIDENVGGTGYTIRYWKKIKGNDKLILL